MTSNVDGVAASCGREVEVMDGALPNILRAEETGDAVSDPATRERVVIEAAADKGVERPEAAATSIRVDSKLCSESCSSKASRTMT